MKLKDIPALLSAQKSAPGTSPRRYLIRPPFLARPARPKGGGNSRPEPGVQKLALPGSLPRMSFFPRLAGPARPPLVMVMARHKQKR